MEIKCLKKTLGVGTWITRGIFIFNQTFFPVCGTYIFFNLNEFY